MFDQRTTLVVLCLASTLVVDGVLVHQDIARHLSMEMMLADQRAEQCSVMMNIIILAFALAAFAKLQTSGHAGGLPTAFFDFCCGILATGGLFTVFAGVTPPQAAAAMLVGGAGWSLVSWAVDSPRD